MQTKTFHDAMRPRKTLVVNCLSAKPLPLRHAWYPYAQWTREWPTEQECREFLDGLDVVFSCETFYYHDLPHLARSMGVKTVLQPNWELLDLKMPRPDLFAVPTLWHYDDIPGPKCLLPVPVATERFPGGPRSHRTPLRVLHIVGRPAANDRNGTDQLLQALRHVTTEVAVTIKCQENGYVGSGGLALPGNVTLTVDTGDTENYWDNYTDQDVLVLPRRYGGLCLPAQESVAAGMPVIMPDISPNEWLPAEWLVPAQRTGDFMAKHPIDLHTVNPEVLAAKIDQFATDADLYRRASAHADTLAKALSWDNLRPEYERILATV